MFSYLKLLNLDYITLIDQFLYGKNEAKAVESYKITDIWQSLF